MTSISKNFLKTVFITLIALCVSPLITPSAYANGRLIIPNPPIPGPRFQPLILERQEIKTTIDSQVARTHIKQVWRNNNGMQLEGEFLFPLPTDRATMSDFVLWMDGRKLTFETLEAGKARDIYENIVRQMRDPGLLEHAGDGLLRCRIFPIPAHGTKEIELEYREVLIKEATLAKYAFPLEIRGLPQPIGNLLIDVEVNSSSSMGRVYSPTHDVAIDMRDSKRARITMEKSNYMPNREFVLFMSYPTNEFGVELITHNVSGEDGYFLGLISPRFDYDTSSQKAIPKDFLFVLDTSGSMEGEKIQQAKDALRYVLRNLNPDDRFGLINFSSDVYKFRETLSPVSAVNDALKYVDGLSAVGGTFIDGALKEGLRFVGGGDRPFYMIFLTDGLPTIGEQNTETILKNVDVANERNARVFSFGVGDDVNIGFIDKLARENGGASTNVAPGEDLEIPVSTIYQKIKSPVLTDLSIDVSGVNVFDVYPKELPDLFKGSQLVISGRFKGSGTAKINLKGKLGGSSIKTFNYSKNFNSQDENSFIPPLWANRKVGYLLNQTRLYGEN
ncbi:VIT and VWA domain-containing protein, partial [bacterium]|nr:VIT and VWA domain-containing protein [bacterium]MBU1025029.1 VIT and VWA domain-containing protein [bacterium]